MSHTLDFDAVGIDALRAGGGMKWSLFPDKIGAFVAEMDFGTAPAITAALHAAVDAGALRLPAAGPGRGDGRRLAAWQPRPVRLDGDRRPTSTRSPTCIKGLEVAIEHFSRPGSAVILPTPAYMPFLTVPGLLGREIIQVPSSRATDGSTLRPRRHRRRLRRRRWPAHPVQPLQPAGSGLRPRRAGGLREVVDRHGGRVFSDEIHAPLVYAGHRHVPYASVSPDDGRPHGHRDVGVQGLEPARAQVARS